MNSVTKYTYAQLNTLLLNKQVRFKSDCELFPNFDITGKVISISIYLSEIIFKVKEITKGKMLDIGSNMKNLKFEIIKKEES